MLLAINSKRIVHLFEFYFFSSSNLWNVSHFICYWHWHFNLSLEKFNFWWHISSFPWYIFYGIRCDGIHFKILGNFPYNFGTQERNMRNILLLLTFSGEPEIVHENWPFKCTIHVSTISNLYASSQRFSRSLFDSM